METGKFSKWNNGVRYLLMVIDVFSKFGWIEPLKNKKGETVVKAFKNILKTGRKPQNLWIDNGVEFYNKDFKKLLEENILWKFFTASNSTSYINFLPVIVDKYNKSKHRSIKMTPEEASRKENKDKVYLNLYGQEISQTAKPKFKEGFQNTSGKSSVKDIHHTGQRKSLLLIRFNIKTQ